MASLKCYVCKKTLPIAEFQTFKSCQSCRKKKASKKDAVPIKKESVPIETFAQLKIDPTNTVTKNDTCLDTRNETKPEWCLLSGKWIRRGEEQRLHRLLLKKVNRQFLTRCAFPIHKYLTKYLMVDIRDIWYSARRLALWLTLPSIPAI